MSSKLRLASRRAPAPCGCARGGAAPLWRLSSRPASSRGLLQGAGRLVSRLPALSSADKASASEEIDWNNLGFNCEHVASTTMFTATATPDASGTFRWEVEGLHPYRSMSLDPASQVLNYGQSIFEGMKAQRSARGNVVLFRPEENAARMKRGAGRMAMEAPPTEIFMEGVKKVVEANASLVPPHGKGSLYLRPLLLGTGAILGLGPAPSFTFLVYCSPVGAYFKSGQLAPIRLQVESAFHRAAPGGTGDTKCAGNYSPVLPAQLEAKASGFSDVLYLDSKHNRFVEEVSSCNIFAVFYGQGGEGEPKALIKTPSLGGTILPGVTRKSMVQLAASRGYEVEECGLSIDELMAADEVFTTGTAVVVSPVGFIQHGAQSRDFTNGTGEPGAVANELYQALTDIQQERAEDPFGWVLKVM